MSRIAEPVRSLAGGSNVGGPKHPDWYRHLAANPRSPRRSVTRPTRPRPAAPTSEIAGA